MANARKDTDLDRAQLSLCVSLIENGVNPEALAVSIVIRVKINLVTCPKNAIKELRREIGENGKALQEIRPESSISE